MNHIGFVKGDLINVNLFVFDLYRISRCADHALDEIFGFILGILENDDVSSLGQRHCKDCCIRERDMNPINKFVYQDMIADFQGWDH